MSKRQRILWFLVLVAGLALSVAHSRMYRNLFEGTCIDDAYISFRYAENLAAGAGLVFNPGEHVEGYSNFLWVTMLAPFAQFQKDISSSAILLGLLLSMLSIIVAARGLRDIFKVTSPWALGWMLLLIAGSGYFAAWAVSGLETGLYAFLLIGAWYRYSLEERDAGKRWPLSAVLFAALALTRPDGLLLCTAAMGWHLLAHHRPGKVAIHRHFWLFPLLIVVILAGYHAWRFTWFGFHLLPNSVDAKTGGGVHQLLRGLRYFAGNFLLPYLPLLASAIALRRRNLPIATTLGQILLWGYLATFVIAGGDWSWGRFFGPILPLASLLFVGMIWQTLELRPARLSRVASGALVVVALLYSGFAADVSSRQRTWKQWSTYVEADLERVAMGKWFRTNLPANTRLAAFAIGQVAYYSGFYTHDMLGITDEHIAGLKMPGMGRGVPGHEKYDANYTLSVVRPDVIVGSELLPGMQSSGLFANQYQAVSAFWKYHQVVMQRDFIKRAMQNRPSH